MTPLRQRNLRRRNESLRQIEQTPVLRSPRVLREQKPPTRSENAVHLPKRPLHGLDGAQHHRTNHNVHRSVLYGDILRPTGHDLQVRTGSGRRGPRVDIERSVRLHREKHARPFPVVPEVRTRSHADLQNPVALRDVREEGPFEAADLLQLFVVAHASRHDTGESRVERVFHRPSRLDPVEEEDLFALPLLRGDEGSARGAGAGEGAFD